MRVVKERIKKCINSGKPMDALKIIDKIKEYKAVSFDIFDTLLKRHVDEPSDIFSFMQVDVSDFNVKRVKAEHDARKCSKEKEITLSEIYSCFGSVSNEKKDEYMKEELRAEELSLYINRDIYPIYRWCIDNNKKVYITSDMYLPEGFIVKILKKCGIDKYEKLYLSSSTKKVKSDGSAFAELVAEQNLNPSDVIHIGDSFKGDNMVPKKIGIRTIRIPRYVNRKQYTYIFEDKIKEAYFNQFINNTVNISMDNYYRFGYECFGPMLWGYVRWLYTNIAKKGITKIYFFSRDGLIMKKAFDICFGNCAVESYYLEVSRRSLRIPILWIDNSFTTVLKMLSPSKLIPITSIFDGVGLDIENYLKLLEQHDFSQKSVFDRATILDDMNLVSLYDKMRPDIDTISKQEYEYLKKYISQNNLSGNIAIVDIGWSGGMQRYLEQTFEKLAIPCRVSGYYTGVAEYYSRNTEVCPKLDLNGYLFDFKNDLYPADTRNCFVGLFETLFLEQGGSVKNYYENESGKIVVNRYPYEYIVDGKYTEEYVHVQNIQAGALEFVKTVSNNEILMKSDFTSEELFSCLRKCGANPGKREISLFAGFRFFDEGETNYLAKPRSLLYYTFHLKNLKKDFLMSRWKTGFMKKMLRVKLPYEKIYNKLRVFK